MTEKVKLPKNVCDALDDVRNRMTNYSDVIMHALVLGYEPEMLQPERELKELVQNTFNGEKDLYDMGYRYGVWDALRIHGIKYDWLEGAE